MATSNLSGSHPIIDGPSKWELSLALFDRSTHTRRVHISANIPHSVWFDLGVESVQAKDNSGDSWNIEGELGVAVRKKGVPVTAPTPDPFSRVFIQYNTRSRQGTVRFLP